MSGGHLASKLALVLTMGTLTLGVNGGTARANPRGSGWSIQPSPNRLLKTRSAPTMNAMIEAKTP